jgi:hypothetical protein
MEKEVGGHVKSESSDELYGDGDVTDDLSVP